MPDNQIERILNICRKEFPTIHWRVGNSFGHTYYLGVSSPERADGLLVRVNPRAYPRTNRGYAAIEQNWPGATTHCRTLLKALRVNLTVYRDRMNRILGG